MLWLQQTHDRDQYSTKYTWKAYAMKIIKTIIQLYRKKEEELLHNVGTDIGEQKIINIEITGKCRRELKSMLFREVLQHSQTKSRLTRYSRTKQSSISNCNRVKNTTFLDNVR